MSENKFPQWMQDSTQLKSVADSILASAQQRLTSAGGAQPRWFPGGINHLRLELGGNADLGPRFLLELDGPSGAIGDAISPPVFTPNQLTPTASWWFTVQGTNFTFMKVLSLGTVLPPPPLSSAFSWKAHSEHWFIDQSVTNILTTLGSHGINVSIQYYAGEDPGTLPTNLLNEAADLGDDTIWRFQATAKGILANGDWVAGGPTITDSSASRYYTVDASPLPDDCARILLQTTTPNHKNLSAISWVTKTLYDSKKTGFSVKRQGIPTSWTNLSNYTVLTGLSDS